MNKTQNKTNGININLANLDLWLLYNDKLKRKDKVKFMSILEEYIKNIESFKLGQQIEKDFRFNKRLKTEEIKGVFRELDQ